MCRRTSQTGCLLCSDSAPDWRRRDAHAASSSMFTRFSRSRCWNRALYLAITCSFAAGTRVAGQSSLLHVLTVLGSTTLHVPTGLSSRSA